VGAIDTPGILTIGIECRVCLEFEGVEEGQRLQTGQEVREEVERGVRPGVAGGQGILMGG